MNYLSTPLSSKNILLLENFKQFISQVYYPCVMAKTVFKREQFDFHVYEEMGAINTTQLILNDLDRYLAKANSNDNEFYSFIATFPNSSFEDETTFETAFWHQLQHLHDLDTEVWDPTVSSDPTDKKFSFSLRGQAFYLIGMHPNSSRIARQAPCPAIVFNLHSQFELLREQGVYQKVRNIIRQRDIELQGSINSMLENFGESSEVKQYSGKPVDEKWKCPFHSKHS